MYKGELYYVSNDKIKNNEKQVKWCNDIGIKVLEYKEPEGIVVKTGKYELVNGVYLCTPKLDEGFKSDRTRYLEVNSQGNLIPGNWIDENPTESWYDYKNGKWANILIENNGSEIYYTWIPRYEFKITSSQQAQPATARTEIRFLSGTSKYTDIGYQIPEAFWFNKNSNGVEDDGEQLTGYWAMKYTVGE